MVAASAGSEMLLFWMSGRIFFFFLLQWVVNSFLPLFLWSQNAQSFKNAPPSQKDEATKKETAAPLMLPAQYPRFRL